jgi:quercetin dioxygenase-like cupin family protein
MENFGRQTMAESIGAESIGAESNGAAAPYSVNNVEILAKVDDLMARIFTLGQGQKIDWHHHTEVADWYVCLDGKLEVRRRDPENVAVMAPGEMTKVSPPSPHHVANIGGGDCRFLLLQGVGKYDYNAEEKGADK